LLQTFRAGVKTYGSEADVAPLKYQSYLQLGTFLGYGRLVSLFV